MTVKCDCGQVLTEKDIGIVETAPADYYPYEGEVATLICPVCGCLTTITEDEKL